MRRLWNKMFLPKCASCFRRLQFANENFLRYLWPIFFLKNYLNIIIYYYLYMFCIVIFCVCTLFKASINVKSQIVPSCGKTQKGLKTLEFWFELLLGNLCRAMNVTSLLHPIYLRFLTSSNISAFCKWRLDRHNLVFKSWSTFLLICCKAENTEITMHTIESRCEVDTLINTGSQISTEIWPSLCSSFTTLSVLFILCPWILLVFSLHYNTSLML